MGAHPFDKPFGPAFVEAKRTVRGGPDFADHVARDVAKKSDFFDGEHEPGVVLGDEVKLFLIVLHTNPSFRGQENRRKRTATKALTPGVWRGRRNRIGMAGS